MRLVPLAVVATVCVATPPAHGQGVPRIDGGGHVTIGFPQGEFADFVGTGGGISGFVGFRVGPAGVFSVVLQGLYLNYGRETVRLPLSPTLPIIDVDVTTSNDIASLAIGPRVTLGSAGVRFYGNASVGFSYFSTTSSARGSSSGGSFAESTNFDDFTFAWSAGGGTQIRVAGGRAPVYVDVGLRYLDNGEVRYLREGGIIVEPDGDVFLDVTESEANLLLLNIGVSVAFGL